MLKYYKYYLGIFFSALFMISCSSKLMPAKNLTLYQQYDIDTQLLNDREMGIMVIGYKGKLDSMMNQPIATLSKPLTKAQPDCTMGHLVADGLLHAAKAKDSLVQVAISNQGGIRINYLSPGTITLGNIYEIMPFDNLLEIIEVPGDIMMQWCQHIANKGGWPVSNISFEIEDNKAINIIINGKPINEQLVYRVATSDYLANGGDDCEFLKKCKRYSYNILMREAMIQYIQYKTKDNQPLLIELENRIKYAE